MNFIFETTKDWDDIYRIKYKYKKQIIKVKIYCELWTNHKTKEVGFWVDAQIRNKNSKDPGYFSTTGKYGISELIIIKNIILEFIRQIENKELTIPSWMLMFNNKRYLMQVGWVNNKRKRAYKRLERYGFKLKENFYEKEIKIKRSDVE